jgi:hypothetical protein
LSFLTHQNQFYLKFTCCLLIALHHAGAIKIRIANKNKSTFSRLDMNREAHLHSACGDKPEQE